MKRQVVNIRGPRGEALTIGGILCDRTTIYGNPYHIGPDGSREDVIAKHDVYFRRRIKEDPKFAEGVEKLRPHSLFLCWCFPRPCHVDNIIRYLEATDNEP